MMDSIDYLQLAKDRLKDIDGTSHDYTYYQAYMLVAIADALVALVEELRKGRNDDE